MVFSTWDIKLWQVLYCLHLDFQSFFSRDIEKYFHGAHLTITARDEDEIDEEIILEKVSKVSATAYNFKEKQTFGDEAPVGPVGSNHKKINPKAELPSKNLQDTFTIKLFQIKINPVVNYRSMAR